MPLEWVDHGGDGRPLVLLHGAGRSGADWEGVLPLLDPAVRAVTVDLPGHGASPGPWLPWEELLDALEGVVAELSLDRPAVAGHSLGGMVAVLWAGRGTVRAAVDVDGHPPLVDGADRDELRRLRAESLAQLSGELAELYGQLLPAVDDLDLEAALAAARCPVTVVSATRREGPHAELAARAAARVRAALADTAARHPHVRLVDVDATHDLLLTAPELTAATISGALG